MGYKCIMNIIGKDFMGQFEGEMKELESNESLMEELETVASMVEGNPMIKRAQPDLAKASKRFRETERIEVTFIDQDGEKGKVERTFKYESPEVRYLRKLATGEAETRGEPEGTREVAKHVIDVYDRIQSPRVRVKMNQRSIQEVIDVCVKI